MGEDDGPVSISFPAYEILSSNHGGAVLKGLPA